MEFHLCLWSSIFAYGVLSLSMEFYLCLRSSIFVCGCWVHVYGNVWVHVCGCWVHLWQRLIACLTVGSLPDGRWLHSPRVSCSLGPGAPGAPEQSNNQTINQTIKQSNNQTINRQSNRQPNRQCNRQYNMQYNRQYNSQLKTKRGFWKITFLINVKMK